MEAIAHPFPLIRAGGAFLVVAGLVFALGWVWPKRFGLFQAIALGLAGFCAYAALAVPPDLGPPPALHIIVLVAAFAFEIAAIAWMYRRVADERRSDAWVLIIVGAHFLPMVVALGPIAALLSVACAGNGVLALRDTRRPILPYALTDSALKAGFGAWLFFAYPRWMPALGLGAATPV